MSDLEEDEGFLPERVVTVEPSDSASAPFGTPRTTFFVDVTNVITFLDRNTCQLRVATAQDYAANKVNILSGIPAEYMVDYIVKNEATTVANETNAWH